MAFVDEEHAGRVGVVHVADHVHQPAQLAVRVRGLGQRGPEGTQIADLERQRLRLLRQVLDLGRDTVGHRVESGGQGPDLVRAVETERLSEIAGCHAGGGSGKAPQWRTDGLGDKEAHDNGDEEGCGEGEEGDAVDGAQGVREGLARDRDLEQGGGMVLGVFEGDQLAGVVPLGEDLAGGELRRAERGERAAFLRVGRGRDHGLRIHRQATLTAGEAVDPAEDVVGDRLSEDEDAGRGLGRRCAHDRAGGDDVQTTVDHLEVGRRLATPGALHFVGAPQIGRRRVAAVGQGLALQRVDLHEPGLAVRGDPRSDVALDPGAVVRPHGVVETVPDGVVVEEVALVARLVAQDLAHAAGLRDDLLLFHLVQRL